MGRWLVTGAGGFIGSRLVEDFALDRPEAVSSVVSLCRADLDLANADEVARFFARERFAGVVHLAASLGRGSSLDSERAQWRDTFEAGRTVIEQAVASNVRHLVLAGSIEELGNQEGCLGPQLASRPQTPYSLCKTLVREFAEYTCRRTQIRIDWFRPFVVYGPGQRGSMLVPTAFRAAASGQPSDFTDGLQRRDFLYVDDLVAWIRLAVGLSSEVEGFHLHHVGTGVPSRVLDVLTMIREEFPGADFRVGARQRGRGEPDLQVAPVADFSEPPSTAWRARVGLRDGISRTADWWRLESNIVVRHS